MLLSFAQFEREMISERVRYKIAASRRKGKWFGGMPILGYTVKDTKLVVDKVESQRVRQIFELYLEHQSLLATVMELTTLNGELVDHAEVGKVLANFDDLWQALAPREQSRVLERLVERFESQWHV